MGGNMKTVLVAAVAAAVVVVAQGYLNNAVMKDGISIRKCDFPFQWSRSTGGASDAQLCNGRVYCVDDAHSPNNPWYLLQSRTNSEGEAFNKNYQAYELGFGESLVDDYWLGLWCLQKMTGPSNNELLVRVVDSTGTAGTALYSSFSLGLPSSKYRLRVEGFDAQSSDMGDSMNQSNGMQFTTFDQDNDKNSNRNCAEKYKGGWWYNDCKINAVNNFLNGYFSLGNQRREKGVQWDTWGTRASVVSTLIVFRPQDSRLVALNPNVGTNKNRAQPAATTPLASSGWSSSRPEQPTLGLDLDFYPDETVDDEFFYPKEPSPSRSTATLGVPNSPQTKGTQTVRPSPSTTTKKPSTVSGLFG